MARYATELLDGFDLLYKRTNVSLDSMEEIAKFVKKLSGVVAEYGKSLSKAAKDAQKGSKSVDQELGTLKTAWDTMLVQYDGLAEKHNSFAATTLTEISANIINQQKEKEKERKRLMTEGQRLTKELQDILAALRSAKKNYQSKCEEADKAQSTYLKAKNDPSIKPKKLNELATKSTQANDKAHTADQEYQAALKAANAKQSKFYDTEMPRLLDEFQKFEEDRITFLKSQLDRLSSAQADFPPFLADLCKTLANVSNSINKDSDTEAFVRANKTGVRPPPPIDYEPYDRENASAPASRPAVPTSAPPTVAPKAPAPQPIKPRPEIKAGLGAGDESLTKEEKREKLEAQLRELRTAIKVEVKSRKGLEKLVKFYGSDPVAQEKAKGELDEQSRKVAQLRENRKMVERQLSELLGAEYKAEHDPDDDEADDAPTAMAKSPSTAEAHTPGGHGASQAGSNNAPSHSHSHSHSHANHSTPNAPASPAPAAPVVAKAKALYEYEATNENELSFAEGDILNITEQDDSGWWFAELRGKTGFIPNNYVEQI